MSTQSTHTDTEYLIRPVHIIEWLWYFCVFPELLCYMNNIRQQNVFLELVLLHLYTYLYN